MLLAVQVVRDGSRTTATGEGRGPTVDSRGLHRGLSSALPGRKGRHSKCYAHSKCWAQRPSQWGPNRLGRGAQSPNVSDPAAAHQDSVGPVSTQSADPVGPPIGEKIRPLHPKVTPFVTPGVTPVDWCNDVTPSLHWCNAISGGVTTGGVTLM